MNNPSNLNRKFVKYIIRGGEFGIIGIIVYVHTMENEKIKIVDRKNAKKFLKNENIAGTLIFDTA